MEAITINVHVNVPRSYSIDLLERQLTSYAEQLIAQAKPARKSNRIQKSSPTSDPEGRLFF